MATKKDNTAFILLGVAIAGGFFWWRSRKAAAAPAAIKTVAPGVPWAIVGGQCVDSRSGAKVDMDACTAYLES